MSLNPTILLIIAFAPLVGAIVAGLFRNQIGRVGAHSVTILGVGLGEPQQPHDVFERGRFGKAHRILSSVVEAAILDKADRRADHWHQRFRICVAGRLRASTGLEQRLDVYSPIAPLARPWDYHRAEPAAAHIRVKRVEFDAQPVSGLAGG